MLFEISPPEKLNLAAPLLAAFNGYPTMTAPARLPVFPEIAPPVMVIVLPPSG